MSCRAAPRSLGEQARIDLSTAEKYTSRREGLAGLTFASVGHALGFYWERAPSMQAPLGHHPTGALGVQVDGGERGDVDDVLATLQTIHDAMVALKHEMPVAFGCYEMWRRDGEKQADVAKKYQRSQTCVSSEIGRAEAYLLGALRQAGVVLRAAEAW